MSFLSLYRSLAAGLASFAARVAPPVARAAGVDVDLESFKRRAARALRAYPTHYAVGAEAYRDPKTRTILVLRLDPFRFPTAPALQKVADLMSSQGGGTHRVESYTDANGEARLSVLQDVAWF